MTKSCPVPQYLESRFPLPLSSFFPLCLVSVAIHQKELFYPPSSLPFVFYPLHSHHSSTSEGRESHHRTLSLFHCLTKSHFTKVKFRSEKSVSFVHDFCPFPFFPFSPLQEVFLSLGKEKNHQKVRRVSGMPPCPFFSK